MGAQAIKTINDGLESGEWFGKLIDGDHEELATPERWQEDLYIHADGTWHWLDDEQVVKVPDLSTLRAKSRREPERQLLVLVWALEASKQPPPAPEPKLPAAESPSPPQKLPPSEPAPKILGLKDWLPEARKEHPRGQGERMAEYGKRLHGVMVAAGNVRCTKAGTICKRLYEMAKQEAEAAKAAKGTKQQPK